MASTSNVLVAAKQLASENVELKKEKRKLKKEQERLDSELFEKQRRAHYLRLRLQDILKPLPLKTQMPKRASVLPWLRKIFCCWAAEDDLQEEFDEEWMLSGVSS